MPDNKTTDFISFPKISRYNRKVIVSEKIDGTCSQVYIWEPSPEELEQPIPNAYLDTQQTTGKILAMKAGSKERWLSQEDDNYGFCRWAFNKGQFLIQLGPGRHFGEWWGSKIQRKYGLTNEDRRWSLFNVQRWCMPNAEPKQISMADPRIIKFQDRLPICSGIGLVPILWEGMFEDLNVKQIMDSLWLSGSRAFTTSLPLEDRPRFDNPEGIVIHHVAGNVSFKKTFKKDDEPKSAQKKEKNEAKT